MVACATVSLIVAGCSGGGGSAGPRAVTVFAASSLTNAFGVIVQHFERAHPGITVRVSYGPSDGLAQQIQAGGPADVFASADERWMDAVAARPGVTGRADFARNRLVVIIPSTNPAHVHSIRDLARPGVKLVLPAPGVPAR